MTTATGLTVELYDSLGGLAVEVTGLPMFSEKPWINQRRQMEMAAEAVKAEYPQLVIVGSQMSNGDGVTFWVERI